MYGQPYRMQGYDAKVDPLRQKTDVIASLTRMQGRFDSVSITIVAMETAVKQVLDGIGVATIQYPAYLAFGREVWSKSAMHEFSGETLAQWVAIAISKWVARGLNQTALEAIRGTVFSVGAPVGP